MKRKLLCFVLIMALSVFAGCKAEPSDAFYGNIQIEWLDETHSPDTMIDNDWLQQKSLAAAEGNDLTTIMGLSAYLDQIVPILQRYFANGDELTAIRHYSNGIWLLQFDYQPDEKGWARLDSTRTVFFISEASGEVCGYEHLLN